MTPIEYRQKVVESALKLDADVMSRSRKISTTIVRHVALYLLLESGLIPRQAGEMMNRNRASAFRSHNLVVDGIRLQDKLILDTIEKMKALIGEK